MSESQLRTNLAERALADTSQQVEVEEIWLALKVDRLHILSASTVAWYPGTVVGERTSGLQQP